MLQGGKEENNQLRKSSSDFISLARLVIMEMMID
jgi:hypothetical protein